MDLGVATHFGQGWEPWLAAEVRAVGAAFVRDAVHWDAVEAAPGVYVFEDHHRTWPDRFAQDDTPVVAVFTRHNVLYDQGTPHTEEGLAAYAAYIDEVLTRFPEIGTVEVWNEVNAQNFVSGPVADAPYSERPAYYAALVEAASEGVGGRDVDLHVGAAHSIPVAWFEDLGEAGALDNVAGVVIHPYTSIPELVGAHVALLRNVLEPYGDLEIHASEYGREGGAPEDAADYLVRMTAALAEAGIDSATWYALVQQRWYDNTGLVNRDGTLRPTGEAYRFLANEVLPLGPAQRLDLDARVWAVAFGDRAVVLWGAELPVSGDGADIVWRDARGRPLDAAPDRLSRTKPIIATAATSLAGRILVGQDPVFADTFHDFVYGEVVGQPSRSGPWRWFERRLSDGAETELVTHGGGAVQSEMWRPYLGGVARRPMSVDALALRPVDFDLGDPGRSKAYGIVERLALEEVGPVDICVSASAPLDRPVSLSVERDGVALMEGVLSAETSVRIPEVASGAVLDFVFAPAPGTAGAVVERRVVVGEAGGAFDCPIAE